VKIKCARRNAEVYKVVHKIQFVCGDFLHVARALATSHVAIDAVFLSPPWGGPTYTQSAVFDLKSGCTPDGEVIFEHAERLSKNIVDSGGVKYSLDYPTGFRLAHCRCHTFPIIWSTFYRVTRVWYN
jgi:16S rRNA G966 N2-methylase RsmD